MQLYLNLVYCDFSKALFGNFFHINSPMRAYHLCNRKFYSYRSSTVLHNRKGIYIYLNPKQNKNKTVSNSINSYWKNIRPILATCLSLYFHLLALSSRKMLNRDRRFSKHHSLMWCCDSLHTNCNLF